MSVRYCPYCGIPIPHGLRRCVRCGWTSDVPTQHRRSDGPIICLAIAGLLLMFTGCSAFAAYTSKYGDEFGYGQNALIESAILVGIIVWLAGGLAIRSGSSRARKLTVVRSSFGIGLAGLAVLLAAARILPNGQLATNWPQMSLLAVSGVGLLLSSLRSLTKGS